MTFTLAGPTLHLDGTIADATIVVEAGVIAAVTPGADRRADFVAAGVIAAGFIDMQVNGAYGFDFTTDGHTVADVAVRLPATGVTAFVPTVITSPWETYADRLREVREGRRAAAGAEVLGVHLEGPYLSPRRPGAHNPAHLRPVDVAEIVRWADPSLVRIVTLAPELPACLDAIRALTAQGILVSAGHSEASFAQALSGFAAGIGWGTHLYNTMAALGHREPGLAGALLTSSVPCGLIADGVHCHPAMVRLAYRAKGAEGLTLVTDAVAAMGMPAGRYILGGREVIVDAATSRLADGRLAGSILTMDQAVRNMIEFTGCSLAQALMMASTTPACVLGLARKGRIAAGCDADLIVMDDALRVAQTWVGGKVAFPVTATSDGAHR